MGADESKPSETRQQSTYNKNQSPSSSAFVPLGNQSPSQPVSRPAVPNTIRYQQIPPYGTSTTNSVSSSSNVNNKTTTGISSTPAARSNVSQNASLSSSEAQTSKGADTARFSPPRRTQSPLYPSLRNADNESQSGEAARTTLASNLIQNNAQINLQPTRSVEENVKNFDDMPVFPSLHYYPNPKASELLNVPSSSSAAKMKQVQTKNPHNKGIGKHKGPKKNFQGNKAELARSKMSEIENGFNLVTLHENNKDEKINRADRTQAYRNKAQHNGLSQDSISCPICMDPMLGMVYQCHSGHTVCESCYENLPKPAVCPSCRLDMTHPVRNRALEDLIAKMKIPCLNREKGCIFSLPAGNLRDHLKECIYRTFSCPLGSVLGRCFWKGDIKDLKEHFQSTHPNECGFEPDVEMTVQNVNVDDRMVSLITMGKFNFLLHVKVDIQLKRTYWLIQNVGTKNAAKNWIYEFHFYNKNEPRRKLFYAESCSSDNESADALFASLHCAVLPYDVLGTFFNAGKLNYKFYIRKMDKERSRNNDDASSEADPSEHRNKGHKRNNKKQQQ